LTVIESHTGGEPFRIVVDGLPEIPGETVLERRRFAQTHLDDLRKTLTWEPRGHSDMYGGWIGDPERPDSDVSVLFLHNDGFSTMCGHGIIALTKVLLDTGILPSDGNETTVRIDTPAGQIKATAESEDGVVGRVRFLNVPSFAAELTATVDVDGWGEVSYDLAFGGAFYAYVDSSDLGIDLADSATLILAGRSIKGAIGSQHTITHPVEDDLGFLYGVVFTGSPRKKINHSRNVCVFADGEVDRSPTGTGVSGRLALLHARGEIALNQTITIESILGSEFSGRVVESVEFGGYSAVIPEVTGTAHIVGRSEFWIDPSDQLNPGFLLR
jgi:trans-L-3-hydroxyproline dehydratase